MNNTPQAWFQRSAWLWFQGLADVNGFIVPRAEAEQERVLQALRKRNRVRGGFGRGRLRFQ